LNEKIPSMLFEVGATRPKPFAWADETKNGPPFVGSLAGSELIEPGSLALTAG
jgi:hypothetical protein